MPTISSANPPARPTTPPPSRNVAAQNQDSRGAGGPYEAQLLEALSQLLLEAEALTQHGPLDYLSVEVNGVRQRLEVQGPRPAPSLLNFVPASGLDHLLQQQNRTEAAAHTVLLLSVGLNLLRAAAMPFVAACQGNRMQVWGYLLGEIGINMAVTVAAGEYIRWGNFRQPNVQAGLLGALVGTARRAYYAG